jgi:hypothetical protein
MLRNPFAPGKNHAYSRFNAMTTIRTPDWRLINTNGDYDLYDLSRFRYELQDVSASQGRVVSSLSTSLNTQGTRPGTTYQDWAGGNPLLVDPDGDGDGDGISNRGEYVGGSDALDPTSRPLSEFRFEDLTHDGFSAYEPVFRFNLATNRDDMALWPATSADLLNWSFDPLEFLDAIDLGGSNYEFRFRLTDASATGRFFRMVDQEAP